MKTLLNRLKLAFQGLVLCLGAIAVLSFWSQGKYDAATFYLVLLILAFGTMRD